MRPAPSEPPVPQATLAGLRGELHAYLRVLWRSAPALGDALPPTDDAGPARARLRDGTLHLPASVDGDPGQPSPRDWYRAAATHAAAHRAYASQPLSRAGLGSMVQAILGLLEDARVEHLACRELPGLRRLWLRFHHAGPALGDGVEALLQRLARSLLDPGYGDPHPWVATGRRLFFLDAHGSVLAAPHPAGLRALAARLAHDLGQMRVRFDDRRYRIEPSYRDDNAWLWRPEPQAACDTPADARPARDDGPGARTEAGPAPLARPAPRRHGPDTDAQADAPPPAAADTAPPDPAPAGPAGAGDGAHHPYPEWDRRIGRHRLRWCTVIETRPHAGAGPRAPVGPRRREARPTAIRQAARGAHRDGEAFELDALVQAATALRAGLPADERVHRRPARRTVGSASLWLLDASASSARPWPGTTAETTTGATTGAFGGSLLDAARDAAWQAARSTRGARHACAVHGFSSEGRAAVHYRRLADFDEPLGPEAAARLGALASGRSTRLGAALRHATALLAARCAARRTLVLVSDGEPHDIDVHDRRYLVEDARRAVQAAARRGVTVRCVGLDAAAAPALRRIFGAGGYCVPARPEALGVALRRAVQPG